MSEMRSLKICRLWVLLVLRWEASSTSEVTPDELMELEEDAFDKEEKAFDYRSLKCQGMNEPERSALHK